MISIVALNCNGLNAAAGKADYIIIWFKNVIANHAQYGFS